MTFTDDRVFSVVQSVKRLSTWSTISIRFSVGVGICMKMAVFWVVAPCSLVEVHQCFRGPCCLHHQGDTHHPDDGGSKHLWNIGKLLPGTRSYNPEDSHLRTHCRENLKPCRDLYLFYYVQTDWGSHSLPSSGYRDFIPRMWRAWSVELMSRLHLVPRSVWSGRGAEEGKTLPLL
jgi:hypothetical protein